jgi:hypothetical protein
MLIVCIIGAASSVEGFELKRKILHMLKFRTILKTFFIARSRERFVSSCALGVFSQTHWGKFMRVRKN